MIKNPKTNFEIERAIKFLVNKFEESGHGSKPVILHSIRVGLSLCDYGYKKEIIVAGLLHDLLEDTDTIYEEIQKEFGKKIAEMVKANTHNVENTNRLQRAKQVYTKCLNYGQEALIIKAVDILDNMPYGKFITQKKIEKYFIESRAYFIKLAKPVIGKEKVYKDLVKEYKKLCK